MPPSSAGIFFGDAGIQTFTGMQSPNTYGIYSYELDEYLFSLDMSSGMGNFSDKIIIGPKLSFTKGFPAGYNLYVANGILTEKVKCAVKTTTNWSDFVFAPDYRLKTIEEVDKYIKVNKHLPDVPSADEVVKDGLDVAKMDALLLQKIEELTLYIIELKKENEKVLKKVEALENK